MRSGTRRTKRALGSRAAFTLAEVLAALMFLAIVVPVAIEALHIASRAGEVAARKSAAARIADRILSGSMVTTNWTGGDQNGTLTEGAIDFRWTLKTETWRQDDQPQTSMTQPPVTTPDTMRLLTAEVTYSAQGKDYSVKMSTLTDSQPVSAMALLQQQ